MNRTCTRRWKAALCRAARVLPFAIVVGCAGTSVQRSDVASGVKALLAPSASAPAERVLAFEGVTVIDMTDGRLLPGQTVIVAGRRIREVGPAGTVRVPASAQVVQAQGKYLMPGLWDMHIHVMEYPHIFFPLLIANGVTGIRDMGTSVPLATVLRWRREVAAGQRIGPRQVVAGGYLEGAQRDCTFCVQVTTAAESRRAVDSLAAAGADFIKVHDLSRETFLAAAAEAKRVRIPFGGHVASGVTAVEASDSGQRTLEHRAELDGLCKGDSASVEKCAPIAARLVHNGTWVVPTLALGEAMGWGISSARARDRLKYWPDSVPQGPGPKPGSAQDSVPLPAQFQLGIMQRSGIPILTGTDAAPLWPQVAPGFSLQDELTLMVWAGYSPLEVLQAATLNPAKLLEATDSLGTVARGKLADLVLLDGNPLDDIRNAAKIRAVVADGRYFDRTALDTLLADVERRAHR